MDNIIILLNIWMSKNSNLEKQINFGSYLFIDFITVVSTNNKIFSTPFAIAVFTTVVAFSLRL